jgi:hypothetical protein
MRRLNCDHHLRHCVCGWVDERSDRHRNGLRNTAVEPGGKFERLYAARVERGAGCRIALRKDGPVERSGHVRQECRLNLCAAHGDLLEFSHALLGNGYQQHRAFSRAGESQLQPFDGAFISIQHVARDGRPGKQRRARPQAQRHDDHSHKHGGSAQPATRRERAFVTGAIMYRSQKPPLERGLTHLSHSGRGQILDGDRQTQQITQALNFGVPGDAFLDGCGLGFNGVQTRREYLGSVGRRAHHALLVTRKLIVTVH